MNEKVVLGGETPPATNRYSLVARRLGANGSLARARQAEVTLGTGLAGPGDAMNPVELLLAALAACMLKGIERMVPILHFKVDAAEIHLEAERQDAPPRLIRITYEIIIESPETDVRLDLLHRNVLKYGTISNSLRDAVPMAGSLRRA